VNLIDRIVSSYDPESALRRIQARLAIKNVLAAYDAAKPSKQRKSSRDNGSGNAWVTKAGTALRNEARNLAANHDLARGILTALVNNVVGANGISIEPQPRKMTGEIDTEFSRQQLRFFKEWCKTPEASHRLRWDQVQRLLCLSWIRDGEVFVKDIVGDVPFFDHGTKVKYSIELLESDMLPLLHSDEAKNIIQGIQVNAWGQPKNYYFYKQHPGELNLYSSLSTDLKPVSAEFIHHLALVDRIGQLRGVSVFASVMTRLSDIKDYEESERIAAKIAACMTAYIKKGTPDLYNADNSAVDGGRDLRFQSGMIFDSLAVGEDVGTIDTNRPNSNLVGYRSGQLRAVASGTGANYSTISRDYDGSYSSQRQELVEGWSNYMTLASEFSAAMIQPIWERFIATAIAGRQIKVPMDIDPLTVNDALFVAPSMPWIDPKKEMDGLILAERAGFKSGPEIIRSRGGNPSETLEQEAQWRQMLKEKGLISTADPANDKIGQASQKFNDDQQYEPPNIAAAHRRR